MKKKSDEGFTLIELLIVIVILGILATVVVFAVSGIRDKGDTSACQTDYKTLEVARESWIAQYGAPPTAVGNLTEGVAADPDAEPPLPARPPLLNSTPKYFEIASAADEDAGVEAGDIVKSSNIAEDDFPADCPTP